MTIEELIIEFDEIIYDAPVDFLGTGSDSRYANREERKWRERCLNFKKELIRIKDDLLRT